MTLRESGESAAGLVVAGGGGGSAGSAPYPFPVVVEVRGITVAARFARLPDALAALLEALRALPLSPEQLDFFDELLGPSAVQTIGHRLAVYGEVRSLAFLGLKPYVVGVYPAGPEGPS
ncbi:hypothetical protein [Streptomyces sp. CBMA123]|uniref:hypothetical protein n=1 Tax=Streptomyces sp. CBMA123 TaxID=1896313 RepID=UPI001661E99C|nr:hypothetical protein [Streptomyces sp. CBMA123]